MIEYGIQCGTFNTELMNWKYIILCFILGIYSCDQGSNKPTNEFRHLNIYNSIIIDLLPNECRCSKIDTLTILAFEMEDQIESRMENFSLYFDDHDLIYKNLISTLLDKEHMKDGNLIAYASCNNANKKVIFTAPVINKENNKAALCMKLLCGEECSETNLLLLEKNETKWVIIANNRLSVQ